MLRFEKIAWGAGHIRVAGVDEAGRGPLAGPVVAAAVVFDPVFLKSRPRILRGLTDSKKLSESKREHFFELLTTSPKIAWAAGMAEVGEIESINILRASHAAMMRAIAALQTAPDHILVDGLPVPGLPCPSTPIVGGDGLSYSIAAASVIAKVTRDRMMCDLDKKFPVYGFARHKGYATPEHLAALRKNGPCECHRKTFYPVMEQYLDLGI